MRNELLITVAVVEILGNIPYIRDAYSGKSKPNIASWSTWTLLNLIIIGAGIASKDAMNTVVLGLTYLFGSGSVLAIAIYRGTRKYTLFDGICQAIAILGIILWQLTGNPNIAFLFVIGIDIFAILPTFRHAYLHPHEETWVTFLVSGFVAAALTALATQRSFAALAIPIDSVIVNFGVVFVVLYRLSKKTGVVKHAKH